MKRSRRLQLVAMVGLLVVVIFFFSSAISSPAVPEMINYQGRLTDSSGIPLSGTFSMIFKLYDVASGGTALWTETQDVVVTNGLFNVLLGSVNSLSASLFTGATYLGVQVDSDPEMTPRQQIVS
ncbi:MAG: hypothetical protein ACE5JP_06370, partial [Candidatus Bipolaricaulia bacterium]